MENALQKFVSIGKHQNYFSLSVLESQTNKK